VNWARIREAIRFGGGVLAGAVVRRLRTPIDLTYLAGHRGQGGWRDLMLVVGVGAIVRGVALWSVPAAWIVAGLFLLAGSILMAGDERS
jgi:hypothetical protein